MLNDTTKHGKYLHAWVCAYYAPRTGRGAAGSGPEARSIKVRLSFMNTDAVAEVVKIGLLNSCTCNKPKAMFITLLGASIKPISETRGDVRDLHVSVA